MIDLVHYLAGFNGKDLLLVVAIFTGCAYAIYGEFKIRGFV